MLEERKPSGCLVRWAASCLASLLLLAAGPQRVESDQVSSSLRLHQRLAVVVPVYRGDIERAVSSLGRWPTSCSTVTLQNVDLVLYYGKDEEEEQDTPNVSSAIDAISQSAGACFARTRAVFAFLNNEENVYPKGPSVMFYKMFLDESVRPELVEYDALAVIEWDVLVASERSFQQLYESAFHESQDFWIKGSHMGGTEFHNTAGSHEMWNVLGHINGNALYNNHDPAFIDYVRYTFTRFNLDYPYDVALWLTVSDFPYSWPLWQRYSGKFVTTNLITNVGGEHIDHDMVSDAIAGDTLFIHGSRVDDGSVASVESLKTSRRSLRAKDDSEAPSRARMLTKWKENSKWKTNEKWKNIAKWKTEEKWRRNKTNDDEDDDAEDDDGCLSGCTHTSEDETRGRVCDESCETGDPYGTRGCGAREGRYGENCRVCYYDLSLAVRKDQPDNHVIMCETGSPPDAYDRRALDVSTPEGAPYVARELTKWKDNQKWKTAEKWKTNAKWKSNQKWRQNEDDDDVDDEEEDKCLSGCNYESKDGTKGRVCDESCETGDPYGTRGCGAREGRYGENCRVCYYDLSLASRKDQPDSHVIMCDTVKPPNAYDSHALAGSTSEEAPDLARKLTKWKDSQKWKKTEKWKADAKWKSNQKWRQNEDEDDDEDEKCLSGCTHTSKDGTKGRVCDESCETGDPYGTRGCGAREGRYGENCRVCYYDLEKAFETDKPDSHVIMCNTKSPPSGYDSRRLLAAPSWGAAAEVSQKLEETHSSSALGQPETEVQVDAADGVTAFFTAAARRPYADGLVRDNLCAFIAGREDEVAQWEVAVTSILQFVPGVRVAIAAEEDALNDYKRSVGILPGVSVHSTPDASTASLFADNFCGAGTSIIYYVRPASVLSRTFTPKDTHSPTGDLLVVHSDSRLCYRDATLARQTSAMLGIEAPTFTCGTDLMLPVGANADLRELLASGSETPVGDENVTGTASLTKLGDITDDLAIPQMLAAVAYSKRTPGVWFVNPQAWVSQHLFKDASIWEIPLVKPRFSCSLDVSHGVEDLAGALRRNLDFFTQGGTCENGMMS